MADKQIFDYLKDMEEYVISIKDISSDLIDMAQLPSLDKDISRILLEEAKQIDRRISDYDITNKLVKRL